MSECGHRHVRGIHGYASIKDMLNSDGMQRWHHLQFALARVSQKSVADWPDARLMGDSIFCLVPRGRAAWSVRFFEALWAGCVPVLLSDRAVQLCNHFSRVSFWVFFCRIIISRPSTSCLMRHSHSARHQTCCSWPHPDFCHRFVIKWPVSRIDESLVSFLTSLPLDVAERYAANARNVRCHLEGAERGEHSVPEFEFRRPI